MSGDNKNKNKAGQENFSEVPLGNEVDSSGNNGGVGDANSVSLSGSDIDHGINVPEIDFTPPCILI